MVKEKKLSEVFRDELLKQPSNGKKRPIVSTVVGRSLIHRR